ncbi:hypothetical protein SAMN05421856_103156 [Chryseobacterium taichungense]|uniref:Uncharacterized protein n=1 Tax=Chryseobacterium taichungense TaxID=295069 RepID=A0A1H7YB44_9FLAO|nr:hypothetical protein SAMN05421856_103156 [Chryseobacterium taichungense]
MIASLIKVVATTYKLSKRHKMSNFKQLEFTIIIRKKIIIQQETNT